MKKFGVVVAATQRGGIGLDGKLPWRLARDMQFFKQVTSTVAAGSKKQNAVIMGRKTWDSIPRKFRPLEGRFNVILSREATALQSQLERDGISAESVRVSGSFDAALELVSREPKVDQVFVIGGSKVYAEALNSPHCQTIYLTQVLKDFEFDASFPDVDRSVFELKSVGEVIVENEIPYQFLTFTRKAEKTGEKAANGTSTGSSKVASAVGLTAVVVAASTDKPSENSNGTGGKSADSLGLEKKHSNSSDGSKSEGNAEEMQYLNLVRDVIERGIKKTDRTGVGTLSLFGCSSRYSLRNGVFPLLTTKRVFWKGVVEELLWLIRGSTNANELSRIGVKIWDDNGTREFLDKNGQGDREVGDLGPVYGFQWRHFGAKYQDCHADYKGKGVDQLAELVETIKKNPDSRRILMSAWNPTDLKRMALPPCHVLCQFYVANGELSCIMYQRSCDLGLGVPFNIASYSLLTCMLAHVCGLQAGDFVHMMGDTHVYLNHVEPLKEQITRTPNAFPKLVIKRKVTAIDQFSFDDFELQGYNPQKPIKMQMAV